MTASSDDRAPGTGTDGAGAPAAEPSADGPAGPGAGPGGGSAAASEPTRRYRPNWRTLRASGLAVLLVALLGVPLGLLWSAVAPSVPVIQTEGGAVLAQPQPEEFVAADGWFSLLGLAFGVFAAIGVWLLLRRHRGPVGLFVVAVGALGAAVLAWRVGRQIGLAGYERMLTAAPVGTTLHKPPDLRAGLFDWWLGVVPLPRGDLLLPAFGAVVIYTLLAGWSRYPLLGAEPEPEPEPYLPYGPVPPPAAPDRQPPAAPAAPDGQPPAPAPVSSDSPESPAPSTAPAPPGPPAAEPPRG